MTRSLTAKLLHAPMTAIRSAASDGNAALLGHLRSMYTDAPGRGSNQASRRNVPDALAPDPTSTPD